MWLPRLMRAADEQDQTMNWARVDRFIRTDPAPHHRQLGACRCNLPRRHPQQHRRPQAGLFGTDFERSSAILDEVRNGWRLAFFKWLAIVLLVVLLVFIGLTSSVYGNDRPHATTLLMVMILGAAVLLGGLLCCVRARAYYDQSLEAAVAQARLASEAQSQTLILVASHSPNDSERHRFYGGRSCGFTSTTCAPIFQFRGPIGLPSYEEAIEARKAADFAPPSYSDSLTVASPSDAPATEPASTEAAPVSDDDSAPASSAAPESPNTTHELTNNDVCSSG